MLTGRRAFEGDDVSDTLASVIRGAGLERAAGRRSPHVRMLIQRCLARDRRERVADMSVALFVMTEPRLSQSAPARLQPRTFALSVGWGVAS